MQPSQPRFAGADGRACAAADIPFVHVSTDYVFDGEKGAPYVETDPAPPINAYGRSKAEGEAALERVAAAGGRLAVIRTSWVFAPGGGGFLGAMLGARERDAVQVVADQWSMATPAPALAAAALTLARRSSTATAPPRDCSTPPAGWPLPRRPRRGDVRPPAASAEGDPGRDVRLPGGGRAAARHPPLQRQAGSGVRLARASPGRGARRLSRPGRSADVRVERLAIPDVFAVVGPAHGDARGAFTET